MGFLEYGAIFEKVKGLGDCSARSIIVTCCISLPSKTLAFAAILINFVIGCINAPQPFNFCDTTGLSAKNTVKSSIAILLLQISIIT